jgi:hypothetical protein
MSGGKACHYPVCSHTISTIRVVSRGIYPKMKILRSLVLLFIVATLIQSDCSKSVIPENDQTLIVQIPGCKSRLLVKGSQSVDSCFTYQFHDALIVDFCASANCCPDTNRFLIRHEMRSDTISVTIADTAAALCRCVCTYLLHAEFRDLSGDRYVFVCKRQDDSSKAILYSANVGRQ